nr:MAG TPA: hypothetical protein [Caudoviricetes sp.]
MFLIPFLYTRRGNACIYSIGQGEKKDNQGGHIK